MKTNRTHSFPSPTMRCGMLTALLFLALLVSSCGDANDESSVAQPYDPFQEALCAAAFLPQNVPELETGVSGVYRFPADAGRGEDAPPAYAPIPAGEPFTLTIHATLNINHDFAAYGCSVEIDEASRTVMTHVDAMIDGEFEGADEAMNHDFILACEVPALEAGTWTFERTSGPGSMTVELPQTDFVECNY